MKILGFDSKIKFIISELNLLVNSSHSEKKDLFPENNCSHSFCPHLNPHTHSDPHKLDSYFCWMKYLVLSERNDYSK